MHVSFIKVKYTLNETQLSHDAMSWYGLAVKLCENLDTITSSCATTHSMRELRLLLSLY